MGEEWFKEQYGHIPRIDLPRMPTPPIYECGSFTSSSATTERTTTDRPSPRPEEAPFTLAIAVQAITEGLAAATLPASAVIIALPEGPLDHDMESPATSTLSSPCAALPTALPPTAVVADTTPCSLSGNISETHPTPPSLPSAAAAAVAAAAASVPPPEPAQSPKPGPKGRPRSKAVRALAK